MNHAALASLVGRYARALRNLRHGKHGQALKIVIVLPQGKQFVGAFFACITAEAIAVPTFPPKNAAQADRLKRVLLDLDDCIVLANKEFLDAGLADLRRDDALSHVHWHAVEDLASEAPCPLEEFSPPPDAVAMLQYTSGSTGQPRGVMISHQNMVENSELIKQSFGHHRPNRRSVIWLPPHHDMGLVGGVLQPVHARFPALLMPTSLFLRHPLRWLMAIQEFRGTSSGGPNFAFQMCVDKVRDRDLARLDLSCWDVAFCGAEPISHQTMAAFSKRFAIAGFRPSALYPCYGMAEATLMISGKHHLEDMRSLSVDAQALGTGQILAAADDTPTRRELVSCGSVHPSLDLRVVDPVLRTELAEREIGELWVSGPSVTMGYWNSAEVTLQAYGQQLPGRTGSYMRTGDLGFVDRGELYVTGRLKEVLIVHGSNHYPQDIELESALACPEFVNCRAAAFSVPSPTREQVVLALETPQTTIDHESAAKRINARLIERYGIRADVVLFVPRKTIKTTTSGKLQRLMLRAEYLAGGLPTYHVWKERCEGPLAPAPARFSFSAGSVDEIRRWIIDRIAEITRLDPDRIHHHDSFAHLALDSVASLGIISELDHQHGIDLPPEALYKHNTPDLLAQEIYKISRALRDNIGGPVRAAV